MGQCYEFGVTIKDGCGHAMRVPTKTGACVCPTCQARCEGRFEACARIVSEKGYVPVTAPQWAVDCTEPPAIESPLPRRVTLAVPGIAADSSPPSGDVGVLRAELDATKAELAALKEQTLGDRTPDDRTLDDRTPDDATAPPATDLVADAVEQAQTKLIEALREDLLGSLGPPITALRDELLSAIDEVRREFADRDKELVSAYDRLGVSYAQLSESLERTSGEKPPT